MTRKNHNFSKELVQGNYECSECGVLVTPGGRVVGKTGDKTPCNTDTKITIEEIEGKPIPQETKKPAPEKITPETKEKKTKEKKETKVGTKGEKTIPEKNDEISLGKEVLVEIEKRVEEQVEYHFSEEELMLSSKELAQAHAELEDVQDRKKQAMSQFKNEIDEITAKIKKLAHRLRSGTELRTLPCPARYHWGIGQMDIIHPQTGEIVKNKLIPLAERQEHLEFINKDKKPPAETLVSTKSREEKGSLPEPVYIPIKKDGGDEETKSESLTDAGEDWFTQAPADK